MSYDLVIKNGWVVDGSGLPKYRADVGVKGGRIASIGRIRESAREVIDADGQVVSPGFVDGHTHMDAQVFWDPLGTSSCWHGITSVVMGNCGFTLAPCAKADRSLVIRNLQRAEDISAEAMEAGIEWTWTTYAQFLDTLRPRTTSKPWRRSCAARSPPAPWASPPRAPRATRRPTGVPSRVASPPGTRFAGSSASWAT